MTAVSLLSGLALVLALLVAAAALARRWMPGTGPTRREDAIEVLSRVGLTPRQGLASVRVGARRMLVSYGEGGVRLVLELDRAEGQAQAAEGREDDRAEADGPFRTLLADVSRRAARGVRILPALLVLFTAQASAQAAPRPTPAAGTEPAVQEATGPGSAVMKLAEGLPDVRVSVGGGAGEDLELSGPVGTVLFVGFLTVLPTLLLLMTGFTRILVVLHLLKQALGTQTAPPAHLLTAMALILTLFVMSPTLEAANERALAPWMAGDIDTARMLEEASMPFRGFMLASTREQDLAAFVEMSGRPAPERPEDLPLMTLTAAFVTSELTVAFQMGFALFLPFVVIDLVVASVLMSMGMFMLPPVMVSLPFKLLLFVLADGWSLVLGSLVRSFA
ncbi:MAG TPA: flagellar type III secretion system pore protein FliP [Longimicrobiales bacterium]|nr:flagellar type III secretion system pore protein FliP [Longimicrobiales bacterium]